MEGNHNIALTLIEYGKYHYEISDLDKNESGKLYEKALKIINGKGSTDNFLPDFSWKTGGIGKVLVQLRGYNILKSFYLSTTKSNEIEALKNNILAAISSDIIYRWAIKNKDEKLNYNLSTGLAGIATFLIDFKEILDDINSNFKVFGFEINQDEIEQFGLKIYENYLKYGNIPPFEQGDEFHNLGLMDGLSGLGYFFLRLHAPQIPSPLFIYPLENSN